MKKKILSVLLCAAMTASILIGCGGKSNDTKDTTAESVLTFPVTATVTKLNRVLEGMAEGWFQLAGFTDELYRVDLDETRYYLADSCVISDDGLTYTLKLKDNLKWHDGEQITADDVVFTMACIANTNNGAGFTNVAFVNKEPVKVEKVDDLTVNFTIPQPSASYFELLGKLVLIPEHAFDGNTDIVSAKANLTDIGSGPYKLAEFKDGEFLVLEKFDDYYGGEPKIDKLVYRVIGDSSAQEVAFRNGEINFLPLSSDSAVEQYKGKDGVTVHTLAEGRVNYMAVNRYSDTWKNKDAVKAVFAALNKEEIIEGAYGAMGKPARSIFSNQTLFYDESVKGYEQNLEEAKALAKSSGLAGKTLKLYFNADRAYMKETAQIIQQQLKKIDVNVEVEGIESNGFFDIVFGNRADYDLYLNGYPAAGDPDEIAGMFDGTWGTNVKTSQNILDMFAKARKTTDASEREKIYHELQKAAIDEDLIYPITYINYCFVTGSNLEGTEVYPTPVFEDYTKLYFK